MFLLKLLFYTSFPIFSSYPNVCQNTQEFNKKMINLNLFFISILIQFVDGSQFSTGGKDTCIRVYDEATKTKILCLAGGSGFGKYVRLCISEYVCVYVCIQTCVLFLSMYACCVCACAYVCMYY